MVQVKFAKIEFLVNSIISAGYPTELHGCENFEMLHFGDAVGE